MISKSLYPAIRQIIFAKFSSAISILGLTTAMIAVGLLSVFIRHELSYDSFWPNSEKIFRVELDKSLPGLSEQSFVLTPGNLKSSIKEYFPEIEATARLYSPIMLTGSIDNRVVRASTYFADPNIADILQFEALEGDIRTALETPNSLILTAKGMVTLFGENVELGTSISLSNNFIEQTVYTVRAVIKQTPTNSMFDINILSSFHAQKFPPSFEDWESNVANLFVKLSHRATASSVQDRLPLFINHVLPLPKGIVDHKPSNLFQLRMINLRDIHLHSKGFGEAGRRGDYVKVFTSIGIALVVLVIAVLNYINLNTANAITRAREISIRKIVGAQRTDLYIQFLIEAFLITIMSAVFSIAAIEIMTPHLAIFLELPLTSNTSILEMMYLILAVIVIAFVCGIYPAIYVTKYRPSEILGANGNSYIHSSVMLRNILVTIQFTFSTALILATLIVFAQLTFSRNFDRGFTPSNMLTINIPGSKTAGSTHTLINELNKLPEIKAASVYGFRIQSKNFRTTNFGIDGGIGNQSTSLVVKNIGHNNAKAWGATIAAGRDFETARDSDQFVMSVDWRGGKGDPMPIILNATAVKQLGFVNNSSAIGTLLFEETGDGQPKVRRMYEIIGIYPDFQLFGMDHQPQPSVYRLWPSDFNIGVAMRYTGEVEKATANILRIWQNIYQNNDYYLSHMEDITSSYDQREENEFLLFAVFAGLAILFACMGLLGLSEFSIKKRCKEIAVRKVLGASKLHLILLALWDFSKPVLIAIIIAIPLSYHFMELWLQTFVHRIDTVTLSVVVTISSLLVLLTTWATIGLNVRKIANTNPINALRHQ